MKLIIEPSVVVITPSIGKATLADAVESVRNQTFNNVIHLIVADGEDDYYGKALHITHRFADHGNKLRFTSTPWNTGGKGFYGHRIYAAYPHLMDADYIMFLDEDNWYKPNHIETLVNTIEASPEANFAYSLRSIYDANGEYLLDDNCESLGKWPIWVQADQPNYLIDTSSFLFKRDFIQKTCHNWHWGWGGDRHYLYSVIDTSRPILDHSFVCSGLHTLAYRLDGNPNSVSEEFFIQGNASTAHRYEGGFPWIKTLAP